jgi:hypothetical protein
MKLLSIIWIAPSECIAHGTAGPFDTQFWFREQERKQRCQRQSKPAHPSSGSPLLVMFDASRNHDMTTTCCPTFSVLCRSCDMRV